MNYMLESISYFIKYYLFINNRENKNKVTVHHPSKIILFFSTVIYIQRWLNEPN